MKAAIALRKDNSSWPKGTNKHCIFLLNVSEVKDKTLMVKSWDGKITPITVANRIQRLSGRFSDRTAPYMAMVLMTDSSEKPGFFQFFDAFIVPRYKDKSLIPVDSYYEREMLRYLYILVFEFEKMGRELIIEKPLFDIEVSFTEDENYPVLPDFIVRTKNKSVVIEVDGSHDESYIKRKKRTQSFMKQIGDVLVFDAVTHERNGNFKEGLQAFINQLKRTLSL